MSSTGNASTSEPLTFRIRAKFNRNIISDEHPLDLTITDLAQHIDENLGVAPWDQLWIISGKRYSPLALPPDHLAAELTKTGKHQILVTEAPSLESIATLNNTIAAQTAQRRRRDEHRLLHDWAKRRVHHRTSALHAHIQKIRFTPADPRVQLENIILPQDLPTARRLGLLAPSTVGPHFPLLVGTHVIPRISPEHLPYPEEGIYVRFIHEWIALISFWLHAQTTCAVAINDRGAVEALQRRSAAVQESFGQDTSWDFCVGPIYAEAWEMWKLLGDDHVGWWNRDEDEVQEDIESFWVLGLLLHGETAFDEFGEVRIMGLYLPVVSVPHALSLCRGRCGKEGCWMAGVRQ